MEVLHSRVQHAVGQGGFHSAVVRGLDANGDAYEFTYVYDCGAGASATVPITIKNAIKRIEASPRTAGSTAGTIDLLVISHYDRDHINGAQHLVHELNVRRILLPYLGPEDLLLVLASLAGEISAETVRELHRLVNGSSISLFGVPAAFVQRGARPDGDTPTRAPIDEPLPTAEVGPRPDQTRNSPASMCIAKRGPSGNITSDLNKFLDDEEIVVGVPGEHPMWHLRFWNAGGNDELKAAVREELAATNFPLSDLDSCTGFEAISTWFLKKENRQEALGAYRKAIESVKPEWTEETSSQRLSNLLSLGMYSGPDFEVDYAAFQWHQPSTHGCHTGAFWRNYWASHGIAGWLGTGDAPLGQPKIWFIAD